MNNTQEITEFDLSLLPGWDEELKCESYHADGDHCSVEVTHRVRPCCWKNAFVICASRAKYIRMVGPYRTCDDCSEVIAEDWVVVPV